MASVVSVHCISPTQWSSVPNLALLSGTPAALGARSSAVAARCQVVEKARTPAVATAERLAPEFVEAQRGSAPGGSAVCSA